MNNNSNLFVTFHRSYWTQYESSNCSSYYYSIFNVSRQQTNESSCCMIFIPYSIPFSFILFRILYYSEADQLLYWSRINRSRHYLHRHLRISTIICLINISDPVSISLQLNQINVAIIVSHSDICLQSRFCSNHHMFMLSYRHVAVRAHQYLPKVSFFDKIQQTKIMKIGSMSTSLLTMNRTSSLAYH